MIIANTVRSIVIEDANRAF
jgi:hypothetical protein